MTEPVGTLPSADEQTAPSAFPAWSLQTEVARLRELLRQREILLEEAEAEVTRLRADQQTCPTCGLIWTGGWTDCPGCTAQASTLAVSDLIQARDTLLIDLRALMSQWDKGEISLDALLDSIAARLSREPH